MNAPYDDIQIFVLEFSDSCRRNEKIIGGDGASCWEGLRAALPKPTHNA